jgi:hypothetical protein
MDPPPERGDPVRQSAKREQPVNEDTMRLNEPRTLADRDVSAPSLLPVLTFIPLPRDDSP